MKFTDVVPEDQDFGLNGGRKSQNGDWVIGVVFDWGRFRAMLTKYRGKCYGGAQQQRVGLYARFQGPIKVQGGIPGCQQANTRGRVTDVGHYRSHCITTPGWRSMRVTGRAWVLQVMRV